MLYKNLGNAGIRVSEFALGCWPFIGGAVWGPQDDTVSIATVHAALDNGINFFDTAEGYDADSHSEEVLGRALTGRRSEAVIATKVSPPHLLPDLVAEACDALPCACVPVADCAAVSCDPLTVPRLFCPGSRPLA